MHETPPETPFDDESGSKWVKTTFAAFGQNLPIGVRTPTGRFVRSFEVGAYDTKEEREIGKLRKGSNMQAGRTVMAVMATLLSNWGGNENFPRENVNTRMAKLQEAFMVDLLYAYIHTRIETVGGDYAIGMTCPACEHEWEWIADLNEMELLAAPGKFEDADLEVVWKLRRPIPFGETVLDEVVLGPALWGTTTQVPRSPSVSDVKLTLVRGAIRAFRSSASPDTPQQPASSHLLDRVHKLDLERLVGVSERKLPKIDTELEVCCPNCEHTWTHDMLWTFDFFFGASSLPKEM